MAKKPGSKTKRTVTGARETKHSTTNAMTGAAKRTTKLAKSAQTATQSDPGALSTRAKGAKSPQATGRSTRTVTKPRGTDQRSAQIEAVPCEPAPTFEQIRKRAYEYYLERSGAPGDATSDWLQAERELRQLLAAQGVAT